MRRRRRGGLLLVLRLRLRNFCNLFFKLREAGAGGGGGGGIEDGGGGRGGIELVVAIGVINGSDDVDVGACVRGDIISGTSLEVWLVIGLVVIG